jgi:hypothetical protein
MESLIVFFGGLGTGIMHSAVFIGLTSGVSEEEVAIAGSGLYLSGNIGAVTGVSGAAAVFQIGLQSALKSALNDVPDSSKVRDCKEEEAPGL